MMSGYHNIIRQPSAELLHIGKAANGDMKILFICLDHFPEEGACTSLLNNLFSQNVLRGLGEIHVLAVAKQYCEHFSETIEDEIHIHRFSSITRLKRRDVISAGKKDFSKAIKELYDRGERKLKNYLQKNSSFYDDTLSKETIAALDRLLKIESFDYIIPVCGRYEAAIAALEANKRYSFAMGVYQVDPCTTNKTVPASTYEDRYALEKELYSNSRFVITTPIGRSEMQKLLSPDLICKSIAMEFPNVVVRSEPSEQHKGEKIRCLYTGKIYPSARDPRFTIKLFSQITNPDIRLELIGVTQNEIKQYTKDDLPNNIVCRGIMSLTKTREEIKTADILVNMGNIMTNQVPSKLFEYIASGKPIVNICENEDCPSIPYMERYPCSLNLCKTEEEKEGIIALAKRMEKFIIDMLGKNVSEEEIHTLFKTSTPEYCAKLMAETIQKNR